MFINISRHALFWRVQSRMIAPFAIILTIRMIILILYSMPEYIRNKVFAAKQHLVVTSSAQDSGTVCSSMGAYNKA